VRTRAFAHRCGIDDGARHHGSMAETVGAEVDPRWYPDIVAASGACRAWQAEFDRLGAAIEVRPRYDHDSDRYVSVGDLAGQHAELSLRRAQHVFRLGLYRGDTFLLRGFAPDLATAARAARPWVDGARPAEVAAAFPFLGSAALAEARERGDARETAWLDLYENHMDNPIWLPSGPFVALAFHEPRLRALRPYTSHSNLCFSTTERYPFTGNHPVVAPTRTPGRFVVHTRDSRDFDETDAAGALRIVLAELGPTAAV
jgi:hypothetical protein